MSRNGHFRPQYGGMAIYSGEMSVGMCGVGPYLSRDLENALMRYNRSMKEYIWYALEINKEALPLDKSMLQ